MKRRNFFCSIVCSLAASNLFGETILEFKDKPRIVGQISEAEFNALIEKLFYEKCDTLISNTPLESQNKQQTKIN